MGAKWLLAMEHLYRLQVSAGSGGFWDLAGGEEWPRSVRSRREKTLGRRGLPGLKFLDRLDVEARDGRLQQFDFGHLPPMIDPPSCQRSYEGREP